MKKIFSRLTQEFDEHPPVSSQHSASVGRSYRVGSVSLFIEDVIAEGGFGVVLRARSAQGHTYALKRTYVNDKDKLAVCKREITIVSSLSHKNIIRYVDSSINKLNSGVFEVLLLTVFYAGTLSQLLNDRRQSSPRMTETEVLRVLCDISEAVSRLHHCYTPIIHRDLKVENILIDKHQNFVLCDFGSATSRVLHPGVHGVARCEEEITKYTTLPYRAPELINLYLSIPLGPAIDIWAMGCILYCMCFAMLPFGESTLAIVAGNYAIPDASAYSDRLHKLIGYLLCNDATKRPDIFQISALAFPLSRRENPVQNLNHVSVPVWEDLATPPRESEHCRSNRSNTLAREPASCNQPGVDNMLTQSKAGDCPSSPLSNLAPSTNVARSRPRVSPACISQGHPGIPTLVPPPSGQMQLHHNYHYQRSDHNQNNAMVVASGVPPFRPFDALANSTPNLADLPPTSTDPAVSNDSISTVDWRANFQQLPMDAPPRPTLHEPDGWYPGLQHQPQGHAFLPTYSVRAAPRLPYLVAPLSAMHGHHRGASDGCGATLLPPVGYEFPPRQSRSLANLPTISDCPGEAKNVTTSATAHLMPDPTHVADDPDDKHIVSSIMANTRQLASPLYRYLASPAEPQCDDDSLLFGAAFDAIQSVQTTQAT